MSTLETLFNYESLVHATAGAAGSIFAMSCIYPLDNIKFRMQLQDEALLDKTTLEALLYILKNEGLESWYKGIKPVLASLGVSNFVYFYSFHGLQSIVPTRFKGTSKTDLLISTAAGVINVLLTSPLWVVNSRLKLHECDQYSGLLDGMFYVAATEGIKSLWSGLVPSLVLVSNPAIHFTVYEALKRRIPVKSATSFFIMGAVAKTIATIATYPIQIVQSRQRVSGNMNMAALLLSVLKRDGAGALYQGLEAKLLQTVFAAALTFMTYEKIAQYVFIILLGNKKLQAKRDSLYRGLKPELTTLGISSFIYFYAFYGLKSIFRSSQKSSTKLDLVCSITAGVLNVIVTSPLLVINNRLKGSVQPYNGLLGGLFYVAKTEGVASLWSGLSSSLILVANPAIHFTVYESLKRRSLKKTTSEFFFMSAFSKIVATVITYPIQLVQAKQRSKKEYNVSTMVLLWSILKKNPLALYRGLEAKLMQTVLHAVLTFMTYEKIVRYVLFVLMKNNKTHVPRV